MGAEDISRRKMVQVAGVGLAAVAGCLNGNDTDPAGDDTTSENGSDNGTENGGEQLEPAVQILEPGTNPIQIGNTEEHPEAQNITLRFEDTEQYTVQLGEHTVTSGNNPGEEEVTEQISYSQIKDQAEPGEHTLTINAEAEDRTDQEQLELELYHQPQVNTTVPDQDIELGENQETADLQLDLDTTAEQVNYTVQIEDTELTQDQVEPGEHTIPLNYTDLIEQLDEGTHTLTIQTTTQNQSEYITENNQENTATITLEEPELDNTGRILRPLEFVARDPNEDYQVMVSDIELMRENGSEEALQSGPEGFPGLPRDMRNEDSLLDAELIFEDKLQSYATAKGSRILVYKDLDEDKLRQRWLEQLDLIDTYEVEGKEFEIRDYPEIDGKVRVFMEEYGVSIHTDRQVIEDYIDAAVGRKENMRGHTGLPARDTPAWEDNSIVADNRVISISNGVNAPSHSNQGNVVGSNTGIGTVQTYEGGDTATDAQYIREETLHPIERDVDEMISEWNGAY